jgi:hypothetical protein
MQSMMEQRICSSVASGIATATRLLEKRGPLAVEGEDEAADSTEIENLPEFSKPNDSTWSGS